MEKICTKCKKKLPENSDHFRSQKNGKNGFGSICKICSKEYRRIYTSTEEYKKKHREKMAKYRAENPEKTRSISRKSYNKNSLKINKNRIDKYHNDNDYRQKCLDREKKYKDSGRRYEVNSSPEQREKSRIRNFKRRENKDLNSNDKKRMAIYRIRNAEKIRDNDLKRRKEMFDSYVASSMRTSVKDLTPEVIETKRLIIQLKRELKKV